jgi:glycosyltransferase involved in cell wall biosynthesis
MTHQPVLYFGKTVTTIHDLTTARFTNPTKNYFVFKFKQWIYRAVLIYVAHKSKAIFTISNFVKKDLAGYTHVKPAKITVTYLAADRISESPEVVDELVGQQVIMYVGRPLPHKNLGRLIEAFKEIKKTHPKLKLVLGGKKDVLFDKYEKQVNEEGVSDVVFTGFVSEGQLRWLYESCSAYVFPSLSEGFGLPGLEAMVHGAPVVSSNGTCLPEIYGSAAHYFDPQDINDMAAKISQVIDDKPLRQKLVAAGKAQAKKYSWAEMARQTLEVYRQVLR